MYALFNAPELYLFIVVQFLLLYIELLQNNEHFVYFWCQFLKIKILLYYCMCKKHACGVYEWANNLHKRSCIGDKQ